MVSQGLMKPISFNNGRKTVMMDDKDDVNEIIIEDHEIADQQIKRNGCFVVSCYLTRAGAVVANSRSLFFA